ncbi:carbohydrate kinase [Streptomyces avermitilis]|uniref:2-oxo-3-deoxygluconate kinase n=3 Tax=Streptomyces avermitilis TaxID=33903 RepID=Q82I78_STRAW|nr:sugar kinase [Streptomyces avermitilis]KUN56477.1 carbohydrate kinase [Streptomyces avermitilis]OOV32795.1 carbohydrate kinase [Streptomyces avermitilis]BAC70991.1 putative 2-oxo-3-deoxygluconate kinase [Streptomyces avermitilis MA-4680 = NBRC 14893]BBJ51153.1 carbohydrate kinase [Streptomyces avermitilis]GDY76676.1 carbohydrate kinase [Streptomyces avermitilis]
MTTDGRTGAVPRDAHDVVALGESMVTFLPTRPGRLADVPSFERGIGGAESNVACVLAAAGHSVRWAGRVGADGFGDHLVEAIAAYGVDTSAVRRDPARPTGVYFRTAGDRATDAHEVAYYRAGSAASAMTAENMDLDAVRAGRVLHLSGITAALSDGCLGLLRELTARRPARPLVSFDVNHRPGLWRDTDGPRVLLELARGADLVFVGDDEARAAWGLHGPRAIRDALPEPEVLVVKQGGGGATAFERRPGGPGTGDTSTDTVTFVRALQVDVVAAVGAGDAFAAGFLSATLRGLPVRDRLRHGHLMAAAALTVPGDLAVPPARDHADRLAALDDTAWETLRLGPGWTQAVDRAQEEVRTP